MPTLAFIPIFSLEDCEKLIKLKRQQIVMMLNVSFRKLIGAFQNIWPKNFFLRLYKHSQQHLRQLRANRETQIIIRKVNMTIDERRFIRT